MHQRSLKRASRLYDGYIFDLDGTIYLGNSLLPTARETITKLRGQNRKTIFLSNNPTQSRQAYAQKLTRLGLPTETGEVLNSSAVLVDYLSRRVPAAKIFVVGEQPLKDELLSAHFRLTEKPGEISVVIASFDRTFTYRKLQIAFDAIRSGARFFATNADAFCPVPPAAPGEPAGGEPDAAAVIAAIEACTGKKVEAVVGKPSAEMATAALSILGLPPERCLMTGDRLETDVAMGEHAGMDTALVLTGATDLQTVENSVLKPSYLLERLDGLLPASTGHAVPEKPT